MISEVTELGRRLSLYYSGPIPKGSNDPTSVIVMEGDVVPYDGVAISVTGASQPPGFGKGTYSVDVAIHSRSRNFQEIFKQAGFLANYPTSTGPVSISYSPPDPQLGGSECTVEGSILATEIYPDDFSPFISLENDETNLIYIQFQAGEEVFRAYRLSAP